MFNATLKKAAFWLPVVAFAAVFAACGGEPEEAPVPAPAAAVEPAAPAPAPAPPPAPSPPTQAAVPTTVPEKPTPAPPAAAAVPTPTSAPPAAVVIETGTIEIRVTDPPRPEVEQYLVSLSSVEVHKAKVGKGSPWITIAENPGTFDLAQLEGVEEFLGSSVTDAGRYSQIRMHVAEVMLKIVDQTDLVAARIPNGRIQIVRPFEVSAGKTTVLLLDFEGDKSLVVTGAGEYIFKPVCRWSAKMSG